MIDMQKQVTNMTTKDAPCEMNDMTIYGYISKYGKVVQGSMKRGTVKVTNIETGILMSN